MKNDNNYILIGILLLSVGMIMGSVKNFFDVIQAIILVAGIMTIFYALLKIHEAKNA